MTSAAPSRWHSSMAAATTCGWVLMTLSRWYSTRFGLRTTRLPAERHLRAEVLVLPAQDVGEVGVVIGGGGDVDGGLRRQLAQVAGGPDGEAADERADPLAQRLALRAEHRDEHRVVSRIARGLLGSERALRPVAQRQRGQRLAQRRRPEPLLAAALLMGRDDALLDRRQRVGDARLIAVQLQGQSRPAEVLQVVAGQRRLGQVEGRGGDARVLGVALQGQQHQRGRAGDRLGRPAEDPAVAVVDAALVEGAVEQQAQPFRDARMVAEAGAAQGQARPGGRLGPGEVAVGPRPAEELHVDVVDFRGLPRVDGPAAQGQQRRRRLPRLVGPAQRRLREQHQRRRPDRLLAALRQAVEAIGATAALHGRPR